MRHAPAVISSRRLADSWGAGKMALVQGWSADGGAELPSGASREAARPPFWRAGGISVAPLSVASLRRRRTMVRFALAPPNSTARLRVRWYAARRRSCPDITRPFGGKPASSGGGNSPRRARSLKNAQRLAPDLPECGQKHWQRR
jgi:hypothetical protein